MRYVIFLLVLFSSKLLLGQPFKVGDKVDMYSTDGNYYAASVIEASGSKYKIHYDAYALSDDAWVEGISLIRGGKPGDRIIVVAAQGTYYGVIQKVENTSYKVKYEGYPETYTLVRSQFHFIDGNTQVNSKPVQTQQTQTATVAKSVNGFSVGMKVQALQRTIWYAAVIKEIRDGKYLVKYDGYNEEEWLPLENIRAKPTLSLDKLKGTTGKTYIRSIRWIATGYTELSWYYLGDNGVIVVNPVTGTNPINLAVEQAENFKNVGTYSIANNQITIRWLGGTSAIYSLKYRDGEIIEMDAGGIMVRQKSLQDNYKLNGTYKGSISYGSVGSASQYSFTKDGMITATRTGTTTTVDAAGRSTNTKTGRYVIKGNTLLASYDDGSKEIANLGIFSGGKLVLNSDWMSGQ